MNNSFTSLKTIEHFVERFTLGTLKESEWTHQAHFVVALWYILQKPLPDVMQMFPELIKKNNIALGIPNNNERGYHETITRFYLLKIHEYATKNHFTSLRIEAFTQLLDSQLIDKKYLLHFYSRELLSSVKARKEWCEPDLIRTCHHSQLD